MFGKASLAGRIIEKPRICNRPTLRENHLSEKNPEIYFRINVFNQYLDKIISEMSSRFSEMSNAVTLGLAVSPKNFNRFWEK